MKSVRWLVLACGPVVAGLGPWAERAEGCDKTFQGLITNFWDVDENWSPFGEPEAEHTVCIPSDQVVIVRGGDAWAARMILEGDVEVPIAAGVNVEAGRLHLAGGSASDSFLFGGSVLRIYKGGELHIEDDMIIWGLPGQIYGDPAPPGITSATIWLNNSTLTLRGPYDTTIDAVEESLLVHGDLEIKCVDAQECPSPMVDNWAYVVADDPEQPLLIGPGLGGDPHATTIHSTLGVWGAEMSGRLWLSAPVTGSGTWRLVDDEAATITVRRASTNQVGPVELEKDTLVLYEDFATVGNLMFRSVDGSVPKMILKEGAKASFGN